MSSAERVIRDYKKTLDALQRNDKLKINALTMLAEDYAKFSPQIVKLLEDSIFETNDVNIMLVRLYLVDSIIKNVTGKGDYAENFSDNLIKVFLHVFQRSDEKTRASLYKLRKTWDDVFPRGKLYLLDVEVHDVDRNWPLSLPQKNGSTLPPSAKEQPSKATPVSTEESSNLPNWQKNRIYVNPNFVKEPPAKKARPNSPPVEKPSIPPNKPAKADLPQKKPFPANRPHKRPTPPVEGRNSPRSPHIPVMEPTVAPGSHAFDIVPSIPPVVTTSAHIPQVFVPNVTSIASTTIPCLADSLPPTISTQAPSFTNPPILPPRQFYNPPPQIRNETPRLPNLPSNNRIFVDGKAYQVFYLDNIAVIERNGVPHKISFSGPPRDVIIDGVAYRMSFGETKAVVIDGQTHYLRFGAPSRELYMGDFAFKGVFGGPVIAATINGRRHEIRLSGPPPEVKIEQDPCYELMRNMQNLRQNIPSETSQSNKEDKGMNINDLLSKLQKTGVLDTLTTAMNANTKKSVPNSVKSIHQRRELTPPIVASNVKMDKFEAYEKPSTMLSQFNMIDLKRRYDSIIKSIQQYSSTCPECGIFIEDLESPKFKAHTDEHIQTDLNSLLTIHPMGESRQRYLNEEEWIGYSQIDELNRSIPNVMEEESSSDDGETDDENAE